MNVAFTILAVVAIGDLALFASLFASYERIIRGVFERHHDQWMAMGSLNGFATRLPGGQPDPWELHRMHHYGFLHWPFVPVPEWVHSDGSLSAQVKSHRLRVTLSAVLLPVWCIGLPLVAGMT